MKAIPLGHFQSWPGIKSINLKNVIQNIIPTAKGHLDQERQNSQSTKDNADDYFPQHAPDTTYKYATMIVRTKPKETSYTDLTGRFPHISSRGNK